MGINESGDESTDKRLKRNVSELLGELRLAEAGVQILFVFLLSVVFTAAFHGVSEFEKSLHLTAVLLAETSTALLTAPAAWHRLLFRTGHRDAILRAGNRSIIAGLGFLAAAITVTVALIVKVVYGPVALAVIGPIVAAMFVLLWFVVPSRLHT
jgi:Flp pilus assembly protein TadB